MTYNGHIFCLSQMCEELDSVSASGYLPGTALPTDVDDTNLWGK